MNRCTYAQDLHDQIEDTIRQHGHRFTRQILAAWLLALAHKLGDEFIVGPYRVTVRKLH